MTKVGDDLFASYRKYKGMDVDSPQYEPLQNEVMSKEEIKKLKIKEYNEKNKDKNKIKRLQKIVDNLRAENKTLKENKVVGNFAGMEVQVASRETVLEARMETLEKELEQRERDFAEFKQAIKVIMRFI